jgi:hypothetical protein
MAGKLARQLKEATSTAPRKPRVLTDLVSSYNTVVLEWELDSLAAWEDLNKQYRTDETMRAKMVGYTELWNEGRREIFEVMA